MDRTIQAGKPQNLSTKVPLTSNNTFPFSRNCPLLFCLNVKSSFIPELKQRLSVLFWHYSPPAEILLTDGAYRCFKAKEEIHENPLFHLKKKNSWVPMYKTHRAKGYIAVILEILAARNIFYITHSTLASVFIWLKILWTIFNLNMCDTSWYIPSLSNH